MSEEVKYPERLPKSERNRRAREDAPWQHALDRLRERHAPDAEMFDLRVLGMHAADVYASWKNRCRVSTGAVLRYEGIDSVVVRVRWRDTDKWLMVVYSPLQNCLRTVLPDGPPPPRDRWPRSD